MDPEREEPGPVWDDWARHMPEPQSDQVGVWRPERTVDYLHELHCRYGSRH